MNSVPRSRFRPHAGWIPALFVAMVALGASSAWGQVLDDYRSAASGNWNVAGTWERFDGTSWVPAPASPTSADGVITIRSGHVVTISAAGLTYDQVVVDAGGQVTVAPTVTSTLANGAGTDLVINGTWLNSGGIWTVTGATWSVGAGGTFIHNTASGIATPLSVATLDPASNFIYRGSSSLTPAISTSGRTYGNLTFESTGGTWPTTSMLSGGGTLTVNGNLVVGTGATLSTAQTGVMTFAGDYTINGSWANGAGTQTYTFSGAGKTIGGSGPITFEVMNVTNAAGVNLSSDISVTTTLALTAGKLTTGSHVVTVPAGATITGANSSAYVNGNLAMGFSMGVGVARTFEIGDAATYAPATVTFGTVSGAPGIVTGSTASGDASPMAPKIDGSKSANRTWTLTNGGVTFNSYDAKLQFTNGDLDAGANVNNFIVGKLDGSTWTYPSVSSRDAGTPPSVTASGMTSMSQFQLGEPAIYTIDASAGTGGTITPNGAVFVNGGDNQSFAIAANSCFTIADVLVDGVSQGAISTYTFTNVTANHTIAASFAAAGPFTIAASAGAGGTITPSGNVSVACGASQVFDIAANDCFAIDNVQVDGVSQGAISTYTFTNVTANHTIVASFVAQGPYTIATSTTGGGTITPSGSVSVACGANQTFTISNEPCFPLQDVLVDGAAQGPITTFTFTNVRANHTISATFGTVGPFTIAASTGSGGTITPSGNLIVDCSATANFTIAADGCHTIADVLVDGASQGAVSTYTFTNVMANHTIAASFATVGPYSIAATAGVGGQITPTPGTSSPGVAEDFGGSSLPAGWSDFSWTGSGASSVGGGLLNVNGSRANPEPYTATAGRSIEFVATFGHDAFEHAGFGGGNQSPPGEVFNTSPWAIFSTRSSNTDLFASVWGSGPITDTNLGSGLLGSPHRYRIDWNSGSVDFFVDGTLVHSEPQAISGSMRPAFSDFNTNGEALTVDWVRVSPYPVACGADQAFAITPDAGFGIVDVLVDGGSVGNVATYTFTNVHANHTISATFTNATYTIAASAGAGGSISPSGNITVAAGASQAFTISPDACHTIADVLVDGLSVGAVSAYTFTNVQANHTIAASFAIINYTIAASAGAGGTISPSGNVSVACGGSQDFTISPDACHTVADVLVDGVSVGAVTSHTFTNVTANHTIAASFAVINYTIVASAGAGGTINPSGNVTVACGGSQDFTISPDACHTIADVLVDGVSVGAVTSHAFTNVTANHTIAASFAIINYTIVASAGAGGTISPSGNVSVACGGSQDFTITPDGCHTLADVLVDGASVGAVSTYTFTGVTANHTIAASFAGISYTIVASAGTTGGGTINPSGNVSVACGANQAFAIVADACFHVADVVVDGSSVGAVSAYTFTNVQANHTIAAGFAFTVAAVSPVTVLRASQVKTGNDADGTTKILLSFTAPSGTSVEVWRMGFGNYPLYDNAPGSGSVPTPPASYPPPGWTLTGVTATGQTDETTTRDYWYFVAYAKDACGNVSPVSNMTTGTLNYHLGDVSDGVTLGQGDNKVNTADVSLLGAHYGLSGAALAGFEYLDVGPTTDNTPNGRPTTDSKTNFEDLVMFAINYFPTVSVAARPAPTETQSANVLSIEGPAEVKAGDLFDVPVMLSGSGDLMAISVTLGWNSAIAEPVGVRTGDLVTSQGGVMFSPGPGKADAALLGAVQGMIGQGAVAVVRFRAIEGGTPSVSIAGVIGRNGENHNVTVTIRNPLAVQEVVKATELMPVAPNPMSARAGLQYSIARSGPVNLSIYSVDGRRVKTIVNSVQEVGRYRYTWDGTDERGVTMRSGVFFARLDAPGLVKTRIISLVR